MSGLIGLAIGLAVLALLLARAVPIWMDSGRHRVQLAHRLYGILVGIVAPSRYWWGARVEAMSPDERADLLAGETAALALAHADSLRCPLCSAEVPHAWALDAKGRLAVAPGPIQCPRCDFRLDACRHCANFLPGTPRAWGGDSLSEDETFGRCNFYKVTQPVERVCAPEMARQLKERGYESIRAPLPIVDSFVPPDFCTAFHLDRRRLRAGGIRWPDARRVALLRVLAPPSDSEVKSSGERADDEQWLL